MSFSKETCCWALQKERREGQQGQNAEGHGYRPCGDHIKIEVSLIEGYRRQFHSTYPSCTGISASRGR